MTENDQNRPNQSYTDIPATPRVGQVGSNAETGDNGFYTKGQVGKEEVSFLVDSGSTVTILSKDAFDKCTRGCDINMYQKSVNIKGVDDTNVKVYGYVDMKLTLGTFETDVTFVICDITLDGIIGHDFITRHTKCWDFESLNLITKDGYHIPCYSNKKQQSVYRLIATEKVEIPAQSGMLVPVKIPTASGTLPGPVFINNGDSDGPVYGELEVLSGIISDHDENTVCVLNHSDEPLVLDINQEIGEGHPILESDCDTQDDDYQCETECMHSQRCAAAYATEHDGNPEAALPEHLREMFDRSISDLNQQEKTRFAKLLLEYQDVFARSSDDLGCTNLVKHTIDTGSAHPIRQPSRRLPYGKREIEEQEVKKMLDKGIIEPSKSPWSSGIVLVTKKDGSTRFCVDYRRLNDVTVKDSYPIPRVSDCFDALSGSKWFNCMDLCSGFWQIEMDEDDKAKTAFSTSMGLYEFKVMPFGLVNAPSTFQRLMEDVLRGLQWKESLLYMDDIITPGKTIDECLKRLENVFKRLRSAHLKLKPSKCNFFQKSAKCLGHVITEHGVETDPDKIKSVKEWPIPTTVKEVRSFVGLASYYRRYVQGFSDIARPLHQLCEKGRRFAWTTECQEAFEKLKEVLTTSIVLAYPIPGKSFTLDTDASNEAVGAVLSQIQDEKERVIAYMSKSMSDSEKAYCITRKELLAVVTALKHFHHYLYGQEILVRTDNAAVSWMKSLKMPTGQVARWLQELNTYNLKVVHRSGKSHGNADGMSRKPCKACKHQQKLQEACENDESEDNVSTEEVRATTRSESVRQQTTDLTENQHILDGWDPIEIATKQDADPYIGFIKRAIQDKKDRPSWSEVSSEKSELKTLWRQWDRLEIKAGMLYRRFEDNDDVYQLVTPTECQAEVMRYHHDLPTAGHMGIEKSLSRIRQTFYWPGMTNSVRKYCSQCDDCVAHKLSRASNKAPLGQYMVGEPMERIMMDILGPISISNRGNRYVLVICDWFSKWTESIAIPDMEAKTVARALVDHFISKFGVPLQIYSDQGRCFESKLMTELCDLLGIEKTHATSMRPQANGLVERFNRTLIAMLKPFCQENPKSWDEHLQQVMMAYRSSPQSSTKVTPNKMMFGREVVLPMQAVIGRPKEEKDETDSDSYILDLQNKLVDCHDMARQNLKVAARYQKKHYDSTSVKKLHDTGQLVWLHDPTRKVGVCSKLMNKWKGPFIITKKLDDLICLVKRTPTGKPKAYHVDRLHHYEGSRIPLWIKRELSALKGIQKD